MQYFEFWKPLLLFFIVLPSDANGSNSLEPRAGGDTASFPIFSSPEYGSPSNLIAASAWTADGNNNYDWGQGPDPLLTDGNPGSLIASGSDRCRSDPNQIQIPNTRRRVRRGAPCLGTSEQ